MYARAGRPVFARPCVGVHKSTPLMSSSLLLQQCPACLVRLTWIVFVIGGWWPYSWCLVGCCRQDLFKQHILVRKNEQTDFEFFAGLSTGSNTHLTLGVGSPEFSDRKLSFTYIFVTRFLLTLSLYQVLPSTVKRTHVVPSLSPFVSRVEISPSARTVHALKISDLQFSLVIFGHVIQRLLSDLSIYLFIQFSMSRSNALF